MPHTEFVFHPGQRGGSFVQAADLPFPGADQDIKQQLSTDVWIEEVCLELKDFHDDAGPLTDDKFRAPPDDEDKAGLAKTKQEASRAIALVMAEDRHGLQKQVIAGKPFYGIVKLVKFYLCLETGASWYADISEHDVAGLPALMKRKFML